MGTDERKEDAAHGGTLGARLLRESGRTQAALARTLQVSKKTVCLWWNGKAIPGAEARNTIQSMLRIPASSWGKAASVAEGIRTAEVKNRPPAAVAPPLATSEPMPEATPERAQTIESVRAHSARLQARRTDGDALMPADMSRLEAEETRVFALLAKLQREAEMFEDRAVRGHPFWERHCAGILADLVPFPEARRAVFAGLEAREAQRLSAEAAST